MRQSWDEFAVILVTMLAEWIDEKTLAMLTASDPQGLAPGHPVLCSPAPACS